MALIKMKDLRVLNNKDKETKLDELRMELVKSGVSTQKAHAKTKEIKRTIARILTLANAEKGKAKVEKPKEALLKNKQ